jgi:cation diffusion facilitator family transporter
VDTPDRRARRVALNVSGAALLLALAKVVVGFGAGSVALLSSALDSAGDAFASFVNFLFITVAAKPPDEDHQFGHGKAENLAMLLQGGVLMAGAIAVGIRAVDRIRDPHPIEASAAAVLTMVLSVVATIVITVYLKRNAASSGSAVLAGDALHYTTDFIANGATLLALILVHLTHNPLYDSILGVSVAGWIAWSSLYLLWNAGSDLMDPALPEEEVAHIIEAIERADPAVTGYRELRTRRAAGVRFIDFELCIDRSVTFEHAHEVTEIVKQRIREHFPRVVINAHAEPVEKSG